MKFLLTKENITTPVIHNKNSRRNKHLSPSPPKTRWSIYRYLGKSDGSERGRYKLPIRDLGKGFNANFILDHLNSENCFDFEYTPTEGNELVITSDGTMDWIGFLYKEGQWEIGHYNPFHFETERIHDGIVILGK